MYPRSPCGQHRIRRQNGFWNFVLGAKSRIGTSGTIHDEGAHLHCRVPDRITGGVIDDVALSIVASDKVGRGFVTHGEGHGMVGEEKESEGHRNSFVDEKVSHDRKEHFGFGPYMRRRVQSEQSDAMRKVGRSFLRRFLKKVLVMLGILFVGDGTYLKQRPEQGDVVSSVRISDRFQPRPDPCVRGRKNLWHGHAQFLSVAFLCPHIRHILEHGTMHLRSQPFHFLNDVHEGHEIARVSPLPQRGITARSCDVTQFGAVVGTYLDSTPTLGKSTAFRQFLCRSFSAILGHLFTST